MEAARERVVARVAARAMESPSLSMILGRRGDKKAAYASLTPWAKATNPARKAALRTGGRPISGVGGMVETVKSVPEFFG